MWDTIKDLAPRAAQLGARYVASGMVALGVKLGIAVNADQAASTGGMVASFAVAGLLMLVDHFIHAKQKEV